MLLLVFWQICISHLLNLLCTSIFCCSIVKVQSCSPFRGEPVYYITTFSLCQEVFQNFFKFFSTFFQALWRDRCPFLRQLRYYITSDSFCQGVFQKFFEFFSKPFLTAFKVYLKSLPRAPLSSQSLTLLFFCNTLSRDSFSILPLFPPFVKAFLQSFLGLVIFSFSTIFNTPFCAFLPI